MENMKKVSFIQKMVWLIKNSKSARWVSLIFSVEISLIILGMLSKHNIIPLNETIFEASIDVFCFGLVAFMIGALINMCYDDYYHDELPESPTPKKPNSHR